MANEHVVVLDNGAYSAKVGLTSYTEPRVVPNCISKAKVERRRIFVGAQLDECKDKSGLFYVSPFQKGYLVNWDVQRQIWDHMFGKDVLQISPEQSHLVLSEPVLNFSAIQDSLDEIVFEDYGFKSLLRLSGPVFSCCERACTAADHLCCLVVDCGHSFTHIVPFSQGKAIGSAIIRVDVGGKLLTNYMKDILSYRQLNMMEETYVVNQLKEDVCFVSQDLYKDMAIAKERGKSNSIVKEYVLPDFSSVRRGYLQDRDGSRRKDNNQLQSVVVGNERFAVPEVLFHPSDIGIDQMGLPEAMVEAVSRTPVAVQPHLYRNIILTGGSTCFPGFQERVEMEVRKLAPVEFDVHVTVPDKPWAYCWQGAAHLSSSETAKQHRVTKKDYEEHGHPLCHKRFTAEMKL